MTGICSKGTIYGLILASAALTGYCASLIWVIIKNKHTITIYIVLIVSPFSGRVGVIVNLIKHQTVFEHRCIYFSGYWADLFDCIRYFLLILIILISISRSHKVRLLVCFLAQDQIKQVCISVFFAQFLLLPS